MFWQYLNKFGPKLMNSKEIYMEFLQAKAMEAGMLFSSQLEEEVQKHHSNQEEQEKWLQEMEKERLKWDKDRAQLVRDQEEEKIRNTHL